MSHAATDAHAESSTYNVDVHKDMWHRRFRSLAGQAIALARLEGSGHALPRESRRAEDALMTHVSESRTGAALATLYGLGYTWRGGNGWTPPTLEDQGHTWSDNLGRWLPPALRPDMDAAAVGKLAGMGYQWSGKEWVNTTPAPSVLGMPLGECVTLCTNSASGKVRTMFAPSVAVREALTICETELQILRCELDKARGALNAIPQGLSAPLGIEIILGPIGDAQRRFAASDPLRLLVDHANMLTGQLQAVHEALQTPGATGL